ncbi:MAG: SPASM domain-containing protein, partial [Prevotellaceae bacterium]|nr:SPASM domain-containing protein [Prevotellaceae bacterium]
SMSKLLIEYKEKATNGGKIYNNVLLSLFSFFEYRTIRERICSGGINYYTILADGSLFKCAHLMNNQQDIIGNIYDNDIFFDSSFAIAPSITELERKCQMCWAKHICSGGCPAQKLSLSRLPKQALPDVNCEIEKLLSEFYLQVYILLKQYKQ